MEKIKGYESPTNPELEAREIASEIDKVPGLYKRVTKFLTDKKNIVAFLVAMEGTSIVGGSVATAAEKPKEEPKGKVPIKVQYEAPKEVKSEKKIEMGAPVNQELIDALFPFTQNELTERFSKGEQFSFVGNSNGGGIFYDRNGPAYSYEVKLDAEGKPSVVFNPVEQAKVSVKQEDQGRKIVIKTEGFTKVKPGNEFLQVNQEALDNVKQNPNYNLGYSFGKSQAPDKIKSSKEDGGVVWRYKMEEMIRSSLKPTVEIRIKAFATVPEKDRDDLAREIGRSMAVIDAYEEALSK